MDKKTFDSRGRRMHQFVSLWKKPLIFDPSNCNPGISSLSALLYLFSVKDYCWWQILIKTSSNAPTLPILHPVKILWPYPNVRLSVTPTTCVYYLSADSTGFGTARPTVFPALTASSCRRRVQHGGGELLALPFSLTSRHRLARESTAPKFYGFAQLCLLVHHHNSLRPSSVNTTPLR